MRRRIQLPLQTVGLTAAFMVWVLISSLLSYIKMDIHLTSGQLAWVTAFPVILGSLLRIPVGFLTNRYGARSMFIIGYLLLIIPVLYLSFAHSFFDLMISGFLLGIGGATFSIGVTALPKYYPKEKQGTVNGFYGIGNLGTALTTFSAPFLANIYGWQMTVRFYLILLGVFIVLVFVLGDRNEEKIRVPFIGQIKNIYRNPEIWFFSFFYFITFGSFVALTLYLPNFFVNQFHLDKIDAGMRTAGFIVLATLIRPFGGFLSDRFNPYVVLIGVFSGLTISGIILSFSLTMPLFTVGCLSVAAFGGIGNGAVFKLVPQHFPKQMGIANGIVSAAGGIGGFFPPLILTIVFGLTGHYAIGFMALSEAALASLILVIWLIFLDRLKQTGHLH
ncbi:MAG: nitrate/nitrite transporter [Paenibacillaceae bacterium]